MGGKLGLVGATKANDDDDGHFPATRTGMAKANGKLTPYSRRLLRDHGCSASDIIAANSCREGENKILVGP